MKRYLIPAAFAFAAFTAASADATTLLFTVGDITSGSFGDAHIVSGHFTDTISFTLAQEGLLSATLTSAATKLGKSGDLNFSSVTLTGPGGPYAFSIVNNGGTDGKTDSASLLDQLLDAGTYLVTIKGLSFGNAQFGGNSTVSAVPEAATWLTMLGGFALIGAAARRRTKVVFA